MQKIQELFDQHKRLDRKIESVVTFGADQPEDLKNEIAEYVVTNKLHNSYEAVLEDLQSAFDDTSNEVGIWVAGFYGSGKSSFAKYLGLSFNRSLMIDGQTFGDKLMSRINDPVIAALHKTIVNRHNPEVVMIDLTNQGHAGEITSVSDIVYYETIKSLGISKSKDKKVLAFIDLLYSKGKFEQFCQTIKSERDLDWSEVEKNDLGANALIAQYAPTFVPELFPDADAYDRITLSTAMNEAQRFERLYNLVKEKTGHDKIIFVLDEVGNYIASDSHLILNTQGMMQTFKDKFRGKVWVIATAQQTLTEDNPNAQINSNQIFTLHGRFPIEVDIEAEDIKEIITKRLLGKSVEGKSYLKTLFSRNEQALKLGTHLNVQEHSIYDKTLEDENFADLYPFLPVHIDILLLLLQKLASRTGGVGLRSVIRLIRDILVDNHLAEANIGVLATPEHFYDVLHTDMDRGATREIVAAVDNAVHRFSGNTFAQRICKTIGVMQILDDFNLTFDNLCALLRNSVDKAVDKVKVRESVEEILQTNGLTLQEVDGKYQFMTNAILGIQEERAGLNVSSQEKVEVLKEVLKDMMSPAPSVSIFNTKTINAGVEMLENGRTFPIHPTSTLKLLVHFVPATNYAEVKQRLLTESTQSDKAKTLYWLCSMAESKEPLLIDIVRSQKICQRHANEHNTEINQYLQGQRDQAAIKKRRLMQLLNTAQNNSEVLFRGTPQQVDCTEKMKRQIEEAAKKVFEKYPYANKSMQSNCVSTLANFTSLSTLPPALNPFGIIVNPQSANAAIDTNHRAFVEIKDRISTHGTEISGSELVTIFEDAPYGWTKDTLRYLVALMLKAGMIKLRSAGQEYNILGQKSVDLLNSNNSFARVTIELNTEAELNPIELMKAGQNLTAIFGCGQVSPVADAIAREADRHISDFKGSCAGLQRLYTELHLQGTDRIAKALDFAKEIEDSDGGKAQYLLGKDSTCPKVFKYVAEVRKADNQSHFIEKLGNIEKIIERAKRIQNPLLREFVEKLKAIELRYNEFLADPDLYQHNQDVTDLLNQLTADVETACIDFESNALVQINSKRDDIRKSYNYEHITDEQRQEIDMRLDSITVDFADRDIASLEHNCNEFASLYVPGGRFDTINEQIEAFVETNRPPTSAAGEQGGGGEPAGGGAPTSVHRTVSMKRSFASRGELQQFIVQLQGQLNEYGDSDTFEISLTD